MALKPCVALGRHFQSRQISVSDVPGKPRGFPGTSEIDLMALKPCVALGRRFQIRQISVSHVPGKAYAFPGTWETEIWRI